MASSKLGTVDTRFIIPFFNLIQQNFTSIVRTRNINQLKLVVQRNTLVDIKKTFL